MNAIRGIVRWLTPFAILGAGVAAFMLLGRQPPPDRKATETTAAALVQATEAVRETGGLTIELDGVVVPLREVTLAAEVPGRVLRKSDACKAGRSVIEGTVLFEIDPRDYEFDVSRLERELSQASLAIEELGEEMIQNATAIDLARQQVALAHRDVARLEGLKSGRIVTESELDRALREELLATTNLNNLQGQGRMLQKRQHRFEEAKSLAATMLEKAQLDLSRTRVLAPTSGVIVEDHVEQDSYVAKGTPMVTIEDTSAAEVRTSLQMDEVASVWRAAGAAEAAAGSSHDLPATPVTVVFSIGEKHYEWDGVLSRQEGRGLDERTRTLPCRVIVAEPAAVRAVDRYGVPLESLPAGSPRALLRGMFVAVRVHVDAPGELVSIPEEARRPSGEVWLIRGGRLAVIHPRPVQVSDGKAIFESGSSGLKPGDRVVTSQLTHPRAGMAVAESAASSDPVSVVTGAGRDDT
jgi:multidrug efflux pump subunit AcrA (membrane-fusion protein)